MQVNTLSAQLGLGSEILDWHWDALSVLYGHFWIGFLPLTANRSRYCTNTGSIPQSFISRTDWNSQNFRTTNTQNLSTLQVFQWFSHECKSFILQPCPKEFIRFLCKYMVIFLKGNLQKKNRHHVTKFQNEIWLRAVSLSFSLKKITRKQRRDVLASEKGLQLKHVNTFYVLNQLSCYGAGCSRPCFCVRQKQEIEYSGSHKTWASKISSRTKSHVPSSLSQKLIKEKIA